MKKTFLLALMLSITSLYASTTTNESERLCKIFKDKTIKYEKNMRKDKLAEATLKHYKNNVSIYCEK